MRRYCKSCMCVMPHRRTARGNIACRRCAHVNRKEILERMTSDPYRRDDAPDVVWARQQLEEEE